MNRLRRPRCQRTPVSARRLVERTSSGAEGYRTAVGRERPEQSVSGVRRHAEPVPLVSEMMQPMVPIKAPVIGRRRLVSRVHQQVYPFVVEEGEQRADHTGRCRRPDRPVIALNQNVCGPGGDQQRRDNDGRARPDCVRPAQQQPLEVVWLAMMAFVGVSGPQPLTDPTARRGVQQGSMNDPFDRPDQDDDGDADEQVSPGHRAEEHTNDDSSSEERHDHPRRCGTNEGTEGRSDGRQLAGALHTHTVTPRRFVVSAAAESLTCRLSRPRTADVQSAR